MTAITSTTTVLPWRHASELAFVRDCFFPHHTVPSTTMPDIYTVATDLLPTTTECQSTGPAHGPSPMSTLSPLTPSCEAGLHRVAVWSFRSPKSVPHAVAATALLVEVRLYDEARNRRRTTHTERAGDSEAEAEAGGAGGLEIVRLSESAVSLMYAMAFVKFVNGFVDRDVSRSVRRTGLSSVGAGGTDADVGDSDGDEDLAGTTIVKGAGESSMYAHAVTIGMPVQFVDLRHRCVHGSGIVDLSELRRMCSRALEWLWVRWWKGNAEGDAGRWVWEVEEAKLKRKRDEAEEGDEK